MTHGSLMPESNIMPRRAHQASSEPWDQIHSAQSMLQGKAIHGRARLQERAHCRKQIFTASMNDYVPSTLDKALTLISHTTAVGILYIFSFILYCLCARLSYSWFRGHGGKRQTVITFTLASVAIICATMDVALENQYARILYVDYSSLPGGPLGLEAQAHGSTILQTQDPAVLISGFLTLGVLLWRVWLIYSGTRFAMPIVILASLLYLAYVASDILRIVRVWAPLAGALPNITRSLDIAAIVGLSITEMSRIMMTFMIIMRLMLMRQKHMKLMGKTDIAAQYLGIAAMLIESCVLSTTWNIGYLIAYILKNPPAHNFLNNTVTQVQILAYFLVLYQVYSGRAWDSQTQNQLSTLRWGRHGTQPTDDNSDMEVVNNIEASPPTFSSRPNV